MLKEVALKYYLEQDMNCAESISRAANDVYRLGLDENAFHAIGGFGGGCCAGRLCGACAGGVIAIAGRYNQSRMHNEELARSRVGEFSEAFQATLKSDLCVALKDMYWDEETKCRKTVEMAANLLEEKMTMYMAEDVILKAEQEKG